MALSSGLRDCIPGALVLYCVLQLVTGCSHRIPPHSVNVDGAAARQRGPRIVSRPAPGIAEYYVEIKPEFDHVAYAEIIAARVGGKVGYIYQNFHAFTVHSFPESAVDRLRLMPEVLAVKKSALGTLD